MATADLDSLQSDLLALSEQAVRKALRKGANEAEAFLSSADIISVRARKLDVDARRGMPSGLGIRVVVEGKVGFAATTGTSRDDIEKAVEEAIGVGRIRPVDPNFKHMPDPDKLASNDGIISKEIMELSEGDALASVREFTGRALQHDNRVKSLYGALSVNRACFAVTNSRGVEGSTKTAYMKASARCTVTADGKQKTGGDQVVTRTPVDTIQLGENAARNALKMLGARPLNQTTESKTVWENVSIATMLKEMISAAADAEEVIEGRSYYKGKIGEEVASRNVTIIDDGQLPEGIETASIDAEGIPRRTTTIIDRGILKTYLYDSYSSLRENRTSNGNATRDWPEPFLQIPHTSTTNLSIEPGTSKLDELVGEVNEGILVTGEVIGAGTSNLRTGEFSVVATNAYLIRKGETTRPLEPVSLAGNFFKALTSTRLVGSDTRLLDEGKIPSIVFEDLKVSG